VLRTSYSPSELRHLKAHVSDLAGWWSVSSGGFWVVVCFLVWFWVILGNWGSGR